MADNRDSDFVPRVSRRRKFLFPFFLRLLSEMLMLSYSNYSSTDTSDDFLEANAEPTTQRTSIDSPVMELVGFFVSCFFYHHKNI